MDSQTRINQLLRKGCPDRVELSDHFWPETHCLWLDQGYPTADGIWV